MVTQTGTVAQVAAIDLEKKNYTPKKWLESMTRLIDIGISGGMEIVETVAAGPARFEVQPRINLTRSMLQRNDKTRSVDADVGRR